ncbi:MAG: Lrp/AsnC family transcriptional regulator [Nitrosopumilus sp.]|nr:Lrp/AsnC family transcriptional regulator [Nitrosopumilus sp.]MDF2423090.1 Lrp/AsnC family transcriptional regulator [Nitrosopumilus sp.]MDF2424280.1 Lrp/AsnC family transcriptional regulator [Nitrosopumilus sp.]MDF2425364.1 Lrp/AsnC family transcriptional regulator [Nitrosopumilus sp.]MDF2427092.1 Lrp/AsnC family transcriptional regulator [Nitrosopumilus sp.]
MPKAYVMMNCDLGAKKQVISSLKKIHSITNAFGAFGTYDIITKLESSNEQSIRSGISKGMRKIAGIKSTMTINIINNKGFSR